MKPTPKSLDNDWRRTAASLYRKPVDSKILGSAEIDVTNLEKYLTEKRKQGLKITLTHLFTLAVARALREEVPELNCYILRGRVVQREHIDVTISILIKGETQMGSVKISDADQLTLAEMVAALDRELAKSRTGDENKTMRMKGLLARIPWPLRGWLMSFIKWLTINMGLSLPAFGLSPHSFGSFVVSNIGTIGLDLGYPALFPISNVSFVFNIGIIQTKPAVVNGEIVPRRMLTLSTAMDHRLVDAVHGGKLFKYLKRIVRDPAVLEEKPQL